MSSLRWNAETENDACYCHEMPGSRVVCGNCRKHLHHTHCEECAACLPEKTGLCDACQAEWDTKFAPKDAA